MNDSNYYSVPSAVWAVWCSRACHEDAVRDDPVAHDVTSGNGAFTASPSIGPGGTFSLLFAVAGTCPYHCGIHPNMKGTITVN